MSGVIFAQYVTLNHWANRIMMKQLKQAHEILFLAEIFPLIPDLGLQGICFEVTVNLDRKLGNRFCFYLCRLDSEHVYIWNVDKIIYLPNQANQTSDDELQRLEKLSIQAITHIEELENHDLKIKNLTPIPLNAKQLSILGYQIFRHANIQKTFPIDTIDNVSVRRHVEANSEIFIHSDTEQAAIALTIKSKMRYLGTLSDLLQSGQAISLQEDELIGLQVNAIGVDGRCTIRELRGNLGEHRDRLLRLASDPDVRRIIDRSDDVDLVLAVQIGKQQKLYDYPIAALTPSITASTAKQFGVDYGKLLQLTKHNLLTARQETLRTISQSLTLEFEKYGIKLGKSLNTRTHLSLFWKLDSQLEETALLFGKQKTSVQARTLSGLSSGGAYQKNKPDIRISSLRFCATLAGNFVKQLEAQLIRYGFNPIFVYKHNSLVNLDLGNIASTKVEVERVLEDALALPCDIFLIFLPDADRELDDTEGGSLYHYLYSRIIERGVASQFISEKTLKQSIGNVLNNVVPGIIAKTGNIPFVFAEPLMIADRFIGLDVARKALSKRSGSINACATIRVYGRHGDLISYALEDSSLEGEEIPQRVIDKVLPIDSSGKVTLVYRDGRFCGNEAQALRERANSLGAGLILVECTKSGVPRLYQWDKPRMSSPPKGLALHLSSQEALVISTQVSERIGLARPLRLKIHELSDAVDLNAVIEATLKLTLLHYGSLKPPRLPIPIFGADRVSGLRLKGIYPVTAIYEKRQFWL